MRAEHFQPTDVALSLDRIKTPKIAILVTSGCDGQSALAIKEALRAEGAVPRLVGINLGKASSINSPTLDIEVSMEVAGPGVWDAMVIPNGVAAIEILSDSGQAQDFLRDQYRRCKPILLLGKAENLLGIAGIPQTLADGAEDPGLLVYPADQTTAATTAFIGALAKHRHCQRELQQV